MPVYDSMAEDAKTKVEQSDLSNDIDPEPEDEANTTQGQTKSHPVDKESPSSISAKRRCVSSACIACRRRKSKVSGPRTSYRRALRPIQQANDLIMRISATEILLAAQLVPLSTTQLVYMILIQIIGGRGSTRRTSTTSRPGIRPCRLSSRRS